MPPRPISRADLFWPKVDVAEPDECWLWKGTRTARGYGGFWDGERMVGAHRFAYELLVGPIPDGLQLDHLCRNPPCVNPAHLEAVTHAVNLQRGERAQRTHCPQGHAYTAENTLRHGGKRKCRICHNGRQRRYDRAHVEV
jgi:hypothetical protein